MSGYRGRRLSCPSAPLREPTTIRARSKAENSYPKSIEIDRRLVLSPHHRARFGFVCGRQLRHAHPSNNGWVELSVCFCPMKSQNYPPIASATSSWFFASEKVEEGVNMKPGAAAAASALAWGGSCSHRRNLMRQGIPALGGIDLPRL